MVLQLNRCHCRNKSRAYHFEVLTSFYQQFNAQGCHRLKARVLTCYLIHPNQRLPAENGKQGIHLGNLFPSMSLSQSNVAEVSSN